MEGEIWQKYGFSHLLSSVCAQIHTQTHNPLRDIHHQTHVHCYLWDCLPHYIISFKLQGDTGALKGPSSQSYGFSSSHVWMWELDYKESRPPKNWCFWTVMLKKTLFLNFKLIYLFNWRLITLQYCSGFCHTLTWISHGCTCGPHPEPPSHLPPHPIPQGHPSALALSALSHASNLDRWSISHMVIYMFQCYSLKSSHPRLLPQSPKVCSLHLCLFCCFTYRVIITIFLNSIYMC